MIYQCTIFTVCNGYVASSSCSNIIILPFGSRYSEVSLFLTILKSTMNNFILSVILYFSSQASKRAKATLFARIEIIVRLKRKIRRAFGLYSFSVWRPLITTSPRRNASQVRALPLFRTSSQKRKAGLIASFAGAYLQRRAEPPACRSLRR
jgi:hypothetical protein